LAFDRLDTHRNGYLTYDDLSEIGKIFFESNDLERIWSEGLLECKCQLARINFDDFKMLMKGLPKEGNSAPLGRSSGPKLPTIPSEAKLQGCVDIKTPQCDIPTTPSRKPRSTSYELKSPRIWDDEKIESRDPTALNAPLLRAVNAKKDHRYRMQREMRLAILDASKRFDISREKRSNPGKAGLVMRRGSIPVDLDDAYTRGLFDSAAHRCGRRTVRSQKKTVSDVTGMILLK
jgi:hypothetical protein